EAGITKTVHFGADQRVFDAVVEQRHIQTNALDGTATQADLAVDAGLRGQRKFVATRRGRGVAAVNAGIDFAVVKAAVDNTEARQQQGVAVLFGGAFVIVAGAEVGLVVLVEGLEAQAGCDGPVAPAYGVLGEGGNRLGIVGYQAAIAGVAVFPCAGIDLATVAFIQLFAGATHRATIGKTVLLVADTGLYAVIKAEGREATDIQAAVQAEGVVATVTAFHHAAFVRRGAAGLEARAIQFGGEYLGRQAHVIADLEIVGQIELVVVHRNIVVLATFVQALLAARV